MYRLLTCTALLLVLSLSSSGQLLPDSDVVLSRARERLLADLQRLPRYTCVQTITRKYYDPPFHWGSPGSCKDVIEDRKKRSHELALRSWDRLRLDIAVVESHEIFSWVGAPRFDEGTLAQFAGNGPLGSGDFASFIAAIFKVGTIKFEGVQSIQGRRLLEYSYEVPKNVSRYEIDTLRKEQFITGYSGAFLLDRDDPDLFRLTVRTDELPPQSKRCQAISEVDYQRMLIHGSQVLIPRETRLRVIGRDAEEVLNTTSYADCHEYSSKSVLHFDNVDLSDAGSSTTSPQIQNSIPVGLRFDWRLETPIDSDTAAAGDPLDAVLRSPIRDKKGAVVAPAGTRIHGRLLLLAEHEQGGYFDIALKFESIDLPGATVPFNARLVGSNLGSFRIQHLPLTAEALTGVGWFFFQTKHLRLSHLDSVGITAAPTSKEESNSASKSRK